MGRLFTSESVTEGHPDKIADQISDAILDALIEQDPDSRVAAETTVATGLALIVGLVVAILQAVTSIQEQTLTFLPKLLVILLVIALLGGFMFTSLSEYTVTLFNRIPDFAK